MFRRDDSMRSFHLEKAKRPVGRPYERRSFKLNNEMKNFKLYYEV